MKESYLCRKIRLALEREFPKSYWVKIAAGPFQTTGLPDLVGCVEGYFIGIEVKLPKRKTEVGAVTARQQNVLNHIQEAKGLSIVAYDDKGAVVEIKHFLEDRRMQ
jgi:Holliday junction resolvase